MSIVVTPSVAESIRAAEAKWWDRYRRGPTRTRWEQMPPQPGDPAPDVELVDQTGRPARLSDAWATGPALIVFWRQFGCGCGMERAARFGAEHEAYTRAGGNVVIVGQGDPARAQLYSDTHALPAPILCDPDERAYRRYGLVDGSVSQIMFDAPDDFLRRDEAAGRALMDTRRAAGRPLVDDPWLLPGDFVVDGRGVLRHAHRYQHCEDHPDSRVLVAAVREIGGFAST
jgi:peroxiredoxin